MARVVFMGTPDFAVPSLAALLREGYEVVGVLTREDQPAGRGRQVEAPAIKLLARSHGLKVLQPPTLRDAAVHADLATLAPDVVVIAAFGLILPKEVLDLPLRGCINVHGSLLPRHRGASPVAAAILAGDAETGVSIMVIDAGLDTGPTLASAVLPIAEHDTTGTLSLNLAKLGAELLVDTLPGWLAGTTVPRPQPEEGATFAPRLDKDAGAIDWSEPADLIGRRVRAYHPWPSAFTHWNGHRLRVLRAAASPYGVEGEPGEVFATPNNGAGVVTGAGVLWLGELQLAGKRALPVRSFLSGARGFIGSRLGSPGDALISQ